MLLGPLGASLLGNLLTGKGMVRAGYGRPLSPASQNNKGKGYGNQLKKSRFLIPPHPLTNFEIQKYCENEPRFNGDDFKDAWNR